MFKKSLTKKIYWLWSVL